MGSTCLWRFYFALAGEQLFTWLKKNLQVILVLFSHASCELYHRL